MKYDAPGRDIVDPLYMVASTYATFNLSVLIYGLIKDTGLSQSAHSLCVRWKHFFKFDLEKMLWVGQVYGGD